MGQTKKEKGEGVRRRSRRREREKEETVWEQKVDGEGLSTLGLCLWPRGSRRRAKKIKNKNKAKRWDLRKKNGKDRDM